MRERQQEDEDELEQLHVVIRLYHLLAKFCAILLSSPFL